MPFCTRITVFALVTNFRLSLPFAVAARSALPPILKEECFAIGSSSKNTPFILKQIGLEGYFDAVSDGNNITHSKPDPEVFLKAAEFLGMDPADCLVVEDAVSGAEAGHAGGMKVACLGDASQKGAGDWNMKSFRELLDVVEE